VLLNSPCVVVSSASRPEADRVQGPQAPATRAMTPDAVLADTDEVVGALAALATEVDAAWHELPLRIDRVAAEATRLATELPGFRSVAAAQQTLAGLPVRLGADPLGAAAALATVEASLDAAAGSRAEVARVTAAVTDAGTTLTVLEGLLGEGHDELVRSRTEIADPRGLLDPVDPAVVDGERGLRPWLGRLERLVAEGEVGLVDKGLESWRAMARETIATARQVVEANARPTRRRRELQGLLGAARAKAGAAGRTGDRRVSGLAERADRALAVPCDLRAAEAGVDAFLEALRPDPTPTPAPTPTPTPGSGGAPPRNRIDPSDFRKEISA
jgi:hypothetical protein